MTLCQAQTPRRVIYENLAEIAKAPGHEHRLELLELMAQGPQSVEQRRARLVSNTTNGYRVRRLEQSPQENSIRP